MDAINSFKIFGFEHSLSSVTKTHVKIKAHNVSLPCSHLFRPKFGPNCRDFTPPRSSFIADQSTSLRISHRRNKGREQCFRVPTISCSLEDGYVENKEKEQEGVIDLKLPRRSLLITFTCDACGARSQRLINRLAYERGLVYVQCSGCSQYHKLVDNLGLVIEYNLQEEIDLDANTGQV